jgi:hypothetical protein
MLLPFYSALLMVFAFSSLSTYHGVAFCFTFIICILPFAWVRFCAPAKSGRVNAFAFCIPFGQKQSGRKRCYS